MARIAGKVNGGLGHSADWHTTRGGSTPELLTRAPAPMRIQRYRYVVGKDNYLT